VIQNNNITVIIPAYNEEKSIGSVIGSIRSRHPCVDIIVGDNNCVDLTARIAESMRCEVVKVTEQGKGATVRALIQSVRTEYTVMTDADNTYPVGECIEYFKLLLAHTDVVVGCRKWQAKGSMSAVNGLGNRALNLIAGSVYLRPVGDLCSGLWGFRTGVLKQLVLSSKGFDLEADLFSLLAKRGATITYVPIPYFPRVESRSSLKISDGFKIAKRLLVNRFGGKR
jgi:glycosyltransferase involved in cell wall biosynthesis